MSQWEATPKKQRGPKPEKPKLTMLYIPADSSSTAFNQLLAENDGRGIIFDTEADGLSLSEVFGRRVHKAFLGFDSAGKKVVAEGY